LHWAGQRRHRPPALITLIRQDPEFTTFRASCNWADRPRQRASEHFVNLPREATGLDDDECPMAEECVVSAIEHDFAVLASPNATDEEKLAALKFLGHWVGDIYQPLHAASQDDRGGNHIRTLGSSCESLHTVWDSCLVEERLGMHPLAIAEVDILGLYQKSDPLQWPSCPCRFARTSKPARCCTTSSSTATSWPRTPWAGPSFSWPSTIGFSRPL
jgi:hypothetical protein